MEISELFGEEDCRLILKKHADTSSIYISHVVKALSSLNGLIGRLYKLKILYEEDGNKKEMNLFLKEISTSNSTLKYLAESIKVYEKEEFYYNHLLTEFKRNNLRVDFAPVCYLCRPGLFVLEDLSLRGYTNTPAKEMLDVKHCKVALETLAKFHSATIFYEKVKTDKDSNYVSLTKKYPQYLDDSVFGDQENAATQWLECTIKGLLALIDLLPQTEISAEEYKIKLIQIVDMVKSAEESTKYTQTILHGDLWSNNFMFKYNKNGQPIHSILIDYQILKYGPMALDVVEMILTNVRRIVRTVHYEELLSYYYHQFSKCCEEHGYEALDFVSYKDFLKTCEELEATAKIHCTADHSITFLINEELGETIRTEEGLKKILLEDRSEDMVKWYNEDDLYREVMTEDLIELRELLFQT